MKSKRILSLIIVAVILLSTTTGVFAESDFKININLSKIAEGIESLINMVVEKFTDIKATAWYTETVAKLVELGIINGYPDGTFKPNGTVSTAEFLKLSMETAGVEYDNKTSPWHKGVMDKALEHKIIAKTLYNTPDEPIKRKDVAAVLAKLIENTPSLKSEFINERSKEYDRFKYLIYDTTTLPEEYRNSIYKLFEYGLINGTTNDKSQVFYNPESNLTRAEVATVVERLIDPSKRLDEYAEYPNRDSIFEDENLSDMTSTYYIKPDIENQRFLYTYDELGKVTKDVILSEKLNPNLNKQVYELTKATLDRDKNYYAYVFPAEYKGEDSRVIYRLAKTKLHAYNNSIKWAFIFSESKPYNVKKDMYIFPNANLSEDAIISLRLGSIWQDFAPEGWVDWFYAHKLRSSFIALFGEKDGHEIYEYVLDEYLQYRLAGSAQSTGYEYIYKTNDIGNIHIDLITGNSATLRFHFSYRE